MSQRALSHCAVMPFMPNKTDDQIGGTTGQASPTAQSQSKTKRGTCTMQTQKPKSARLNGAFILPVLTIMLASTFTVISAPEAEAKSCAAAVGKGWGVTQTKARQRANLSAQRKINRTCVKRHGHIRTCINPAKFRGLRCKSAVKTINGIARNGQSCTVRAEACF